MNTDDLQSADTQHHTSGPEKIRSIVIDSSDGEASDGEDAAAEHTRKAQSDDFNIENLRGIEILCEETLTIPVNEYITKQLCGGFLRAVGSQRPADMQLVFEQNPEVLFTYTPLEAFFEGDSLLLSKRLIILEGNCRSVLLKRAELTGQPLPRTITIVGRRLSDVDFTYLFKLGHTLTIDMVDTPRPLIDRVDVATTLAALHCASGEATEKSTFHPTDENGFIWGCLYPLFPNAKTVKKNVQSKFATWATSPKNPRRLSNEKWRILTFFCNVEAKEAVLHLNKQKRIIPTRDHVCDSLVGLSWKVDSDVASLIFRAANSKEPRQRSTS